MHGFIIEIFDGLGILFMVGVLLDLIEPDRIRFRNRLLRDVALGLILALLSFVVMSLGYEVSPGVHIDVRSILLFTVGLYFGLVPTLFAVATCTVMRLTAGGAGMVPGILLVLTSASVGLAYRRRFRDCLGRIPFRCLIAGSCLIHLPMALLMAIAMADSGAGSAMIARDILWGIPIYTLAATLICLFFSRRIAGRERRRKLEASEAEARKLSSAVEQSPASVVITATDGTIEYVNEKFTQLTGYSREEAIGQNPSILKSGELPATVYAEMWETILAGKSWRGEFHNKRKDGSLFWEMAMIAPIVAPDGTVEKFVAVKEDITGRKELEAALRRSTARAEAATEAKSNFLNVMSHELMTPLNAIIGPSELLLEMSRKEDAEMLRIIQQGAFRLKRIFEDLLTVSRGGQAMDADSAASLVELSQFMESIEDKHRPILAEKDQQLLIEIDESLPQELMLFEEPLRRVINLLLENVAKHADPGTVRLRLASAEGGVTFHVLDEGPGLPEAVDTALSEAFLQGDMSNTRKVDGVGLGLAVCHALAVSMGGNISTSNRQGGGSEFVLYCPLLSNETEFAAPKRAKKIS